MKRESVIFEKSETMFESIFSDIVTFSFLLLCMWYSYSQGGGWWTFFTCSMFIGTLSFKSPFGERKMWRKISTKKEAVEWANSLDDDEQDADEDNAA